ncbi:MAG TPA: cytidylate kinase family protein [Nitrososphaera sp.]|nr:cytidylate kinase family protein [Thermoproteota archaeon]HZA49073.1 cytidylate kinase family protein [Nitrososphaera sp.]
MVANKLFSIVISGWPAVGKTTIACKLAEEFDIVMYNGGDILKMLAEEDKGYSVKRDDWWDTIEAKKFMKERKSDPSFDKKVDDKLIQIVKKGGAVITSYTLPWLVVDESIITIKFWLRGSPENRAKRMANRDSISFAEAKRIIKLRDKENKRIYYRLYGFRFGEDLTVFDYVLNTDRLSLDSLVEISKLIVRRHIGVPL